MNRYPVVGDCIRVAGSRSDLVVIGVDSIPEGNDLYAKVFFTIREVDPGKSNAKGSAWQTEGFAEFGKHIRVQDITFIRQMKLVKSVVYTEKS